MPSVLAFFTESPPEGATKISQHNEPQPSPQEYDCGCVAVTVVTDRDFLRYEEPFEMWRVQECNRPDCEVVPYREAE